MVEHILLHEVGLFLETLEAFRGRILAGLSGVGSLGELIRQVNQHQIARDGSINGVEYSVHGIGCRLWEEGGRGVDVDVLDGDVEVFDAWRIWLFTQNITPAKAWSLDEVEIFLERLVAADVIARVKPGWFSGSALRGSDC
ncbi:DUF6896 domain-containing protein [Actinomadura geliboluensis]|uniref:DUF6896 domain-containing protein n=1 Tax=Actinomadura geliboluensis TaxID=882440 RepID=A0A5S4GDR6_9ACTN|nr:hypothetical protein [Actinomadura geliboluensis]TMR31143.1 hypothetical protein ETD96_32245 [Actinomadura geliboluensis]